ncbi:interferon gamma-like [Pseudophryne corroboree]|uniref:interferon gamma-like n=1 Tax=Pseudophryne corroboree TaxID=495146 RepID=UPI003081A08F
MIKYFKMFLLYCTILCYIRQVNGYNIDLMTARKDIENLRKYLVSMNKNTKDSSDTDDTVLFSKLLDSWTEDGEKKLLLSQIVPMYLKMLDSMKSTELKDSITNLTQMLNSSYDDFMKQSDQKLKGLNEVKKIQLSDIKNQRAAIKELLRILRDISIMSQRKEKPKCKRENTRRRRGC